MNQYGFYNQYLLSGELPYVVMFGGTGKGNDDRNPYPAQRSVGIFDRTDLRGRQAPLCSAQPPEDGRSQTGTRLATLGPSSGRNHPLLEVIVARSVNNMPQNTATRRTP